mmetsp:Transcript_9145/g.21950  ORF Transcript_9145/g.21950 Transcript_9145/m.21950 type:complete len:200 (-) Transcript_9145:84-683(-)
MASRAMSVAPVVPFLNPMGMDRPDASSRCTWDSVVLAPMAPQTTRSATYWGEITSRNSTAQGSPFLLMSNRSLRPVRRPVLIWNSPERLGSLISPFQPMVVRGFSKYTRMTMTRVSLNSSRIFTSLSAYSSAAFTSWIEHGPTMQINRLSLPLTQSDTCRRTSVMKNPSSSSTGRSSIKQAGGIKGLICSTCTLSDDPR